MAKTKISLGGDSTTYFRPNQMKAGDTVSGIYQGFFTDRYQKRAHKIQLANGTQGVINGSAQLDKLLEQVEVGDSVEVIYRGLKKMTSGKFPGKDAHTFDVFVDDESVAKPAARKASAL
jgi:hypothetical protein